MYTNTPLVSIITPVYNSQDYLAQTIDSILSQTFKGWELILIDDCSEDESLSIAEYYVAADSRVKLKRLSKNSGPAAARNAGIEIAKGRYIAFCDSDDIWDHAKLERQISEMKSQNAFVCHSSVYYVTTNSAVFMGAKRRVELKDMRSRNWIPNSSGIYDVDKVGKVFLSNCYHEDYDMWCYAISVAGFSIGLPEPLVSINRRNDSVSANKIKSVLWHVQAQRRIFKMSYFEVILRMVLNLKSRVVQLVAR